jgi:hypothetical protein
MNETTTAMHLEPTGSAPRACDYCGSTFTPKRAWSRFCSSAHRTAYHTAEGRAKAIAEAAPRMFEALQQIARGASHPIAIATEAIHDLKAPEPIPTLKAAADSLADTIEKVNRDADRREAIVVGPGALPT